MISKSKLTAAIRFIVAVLKAVNSGMLQKRDPPAAQAADSAPASEPARRKPARKKKGAIP